MIDATAPIAPQVVPARQNQVAAGSRALAEAFMDDPLFAWLVPDRMRRPWLRALMGETLRLCWDDGVVWTAGGPHGGWLGLVPPDAFPPTPRQLMRFARSVGWASLRLRFPWSSARSALWALGRIERMHPETPHWYVAVVGVHPRHQGAGHGGAMLRAACDLADGERMPLYLETSNPVNLPFYERYGFVVHDELRLPGDDGPGIWTMWREPDHAS